MADKLKLFAGAGIAAEPIGAVAPDDLRWFRAYLNSGSGTTADFGLAAFEKKHRFKLPPSYRDYIRKVGPQAFNNVDGEEGFTTHILAPADFDTSGYRQGVIKADDDDSNAVDGIMFARTDHGDCFCFDLRGDGQEYPIYQYLHEGNYFERYARNFVECLRRFVGD